MIEPIGVGVEIHGDTFRGAEGDEGILPGLDAGVPIACRS